MSEAGAKKQQFRQTLRATGNVREACEASSISEAEIISIVDEVEVLGRVDDFAMEERVSESFPDAVKLLIDYMKCGDPKLQFDAACKLIDIRMTVYKERNKKKLVTSVLRHVKENDGWTFKKKD